MLIIITCIIILDYVDKCAKNPTSIYIVHKIVNLTIKHVYNIYIQGLMVNLDHKDQLDKEVNQGNQGHSDSQVCLVNVEDLDQLVNLDPLEMQELLV